MYYEEKTINGILHFRNTPNGKWIKMNLIDLNNKFTMYKNLLEESRKEMEFWRQSYLDIRMSNDK